ncbi:hypothetical protein GDO86_002200 [Hymenochirus boettgeri]|uniref:Uncharacterized protein n=1 Tax=Hymenochirus boettgeri TaxID=247094 RepID=A0A8T2KGX4_9PIPI|nr:hypothetical protein GDO86_002200 [Hymenochirus boettgeri]
MHLQFLENKTGTHVFYIFPHLRFIKSFITFCIVATLHEATTNPMRTSHKPHVNELASLYNRKLCVSVLGKLQIVLYHCHYRNKSHD